MLISFAKKTSQSACVTIRKQYELAIAFGMGKESTDLVYRYKDKKPLLICCMEPKSCDVDPRVVEVFAQKLELDIDVLSDISFGESWNDDKVLCYTNSILEYYKRKAPFKILIMGRRAEDFIKRGLASELQVERFRSRLHTIKRVRFPLWDC